MIERMLRFSTRFPATHLNKTAAFMMQVPNSAAVTAALQSHTY
jgi:hypothetical protein